METLREILRVDVTEFTLTYQRRRAADQLQSAAAFLDLVSITGAGGLGAWRLKIEPGTYFLALGRQDLRLGHPGFDDSYIVKSSYPALAAFWLTPDIQAAMLAAYDPLSVTPFEWHYNSSWTANSRLPVPLQVNGRIELTGLANAIGPALPRFAATPPHVTKLDEALHSMALLHRRGADLAQQWQRALVEQTPWQPFTTVPPRLSTNPHHAFVLQLPARELRLDTPWLKPTKGRATLFARLTCTPPLPSERLAEWLRDAPPPTPIASSPLETSLAWPIEQAPLATLRACLADAFAHGSSTQPFR